MRQNSWEANSRHAVNKITVTFSYAKQMVNYRVPKKPHERGSLSRMTGQYVWDLSRAVGLG
jgi:hypothetical protein